MSETDKDKDNDKKDPEIMVLPSGLTLILNHDSTFATTSWSLEVNIGYLTCLKEENDLPHIVEHLLLARVSLSMPYKNFDERGFKDSQTWASGYTSPSNTVYYGEVPSYDINSVIEMLSRMVTNPSFKNYAKEYEVLKTEIGNYLDSPARHRICLLFKAGFGLHRNFLDDVVWKHPSLDKIKKFIKKYYTTSNMTLYIHGNFNKDDLVKKINKEFENTPTKLVPLAPVGIWKPSLQIQKKEITNSYVGILYTLPHLNPRHFLVGKIFAYLFRQMMYEEETGIYRREITLMREFNIETLFITFNINPPLVAQTLSQVIGLFKKKIPSHYKKDFDKLKEDHAFVITLCAKTQLYERFGVLGAPRLLKESIKSIKWEDIEIFQSYFVNQKPAIAIYGNIDAKSIKQVESFYSKLGE